MGGEGTGQQRKDTRPWEHVGGVDTNMQHNIVGTQGNGSARNEGKGGGRETWYGSDGVRGIGMRW